MVKQYNRIVSSFCLAEICAQRRSTAIGVDKKKIRWVKYNPKDGMTKISLGNPEHWRIVRDARERSRSDLKNDTMVLFAVRKDDGSLEKRVVNVDIISSTTKNRVTMFEEIPDSLSSQRNFLLSGSFTIFFSLTLRTIYYLNY